MANLYRVFRRLGNARLSHGEGISVGCRAAAQVYFDSRRIVVEVKLAIGSLRTCSFEAAEVVKGATMPNGGWLCIHVSQRLGRD